MPLCKLTRENLTWEWGQLYLQEFVIFNYEPWESFLQELKSEPEGIVLHTSLLAQVSFQARYSVY